jgi:hypothetical protein
LHAQNLISTQEALNHATNLEDLALKLRGVDRGVWNGKDGAAPGEGAPPPPPVEKGSKESGPMVIDLPRENPQPPKKKI